MNKETIEKLKEAFIAFDELTTNKIESLECSIFYCPGEQEPDIGDYWIDIFNIFLMDKYGIDPLTEKEVNKLSRYFFDLLDIGKWSK